MDNEVIKLPTIKEQVYKIIKDKIIAGEIKPGEWLQESKLAKILNVSRSPVREALKELVGEGLLENIPNKGVFVKILSKKDIYNIFEFREVMEKFAIEKSVEVATEEDFEMLDKIYAKLKKKYDKNDVKEYCKLDAELHNMLFTISRNEIISNMVNNVNPLLQPFRTISLSRDGRFKESLEEHRGLVEGIKERNFEKAWKYNNIHLKLARDVIIEYLDSLNISNQ
ncbi:GntR family transcriptional regulator [Sedimentibacter saalensis]|uniref:DNA-binding GntR family transcriptional regulator n=1 Tax=Sedimentibacter saalensis TaxID=130788 RepID=A0A562JL33_9FIRM|nr:GntR family transcriptional regulator [Sedimentibacter saalensis]TWH83848.1 DNA-binding GntR family transcriptional regulator [Sedimentibacter saalensis]